MSEHHEPDTFLGPPPDTEHVRRLLAKDAEQIGFEMSGSRLWAHLPEQHDALFELIAAAASAASLSVRERGILIAAAASTFGDSYCSLAWGQKLAQLAGTELVVAVLDGSDDGLSDSERALATWARRVASNPNGTRVEDIATLRAVGYDDAQILAITVFVSLRLAFATVNDALGVHPDPEMADSVPAEVRGVVTRGRRPVVRA
jgi:uncharacterized peroxidase-related enzyme